MLEEDPIYKNQEGFKEGNEGEEARGSDFKSTIFNEHVDLSQVEELFYDTEQIFKTGRYYELLNNIKNTLPIGETAVKRFHGKGLSIAILSSEKFLDSLSAIGLDTSEAELILSYSKENFENGMYDKAISGIKEFNDVIPTLKKNYKERLLVAIVDIEEDIKMAKRIGANLIETERLLIEAKAFLENDILFDCHETLKMAKELLAKTREDRITIIKEAVGFVERMIHQARDIGANIEPAEKHLDQAKSQFMDEEFQMCMHTTIQAEEITNELISEQVERAQALQNSLDERFKVVATAIPYKHLKSGEWPPDPMKKTQKPTCKTCGESLEYIDRYRCWFCNHCEKYIK
ncbi:MAG: hypothetical protein JSW00_13865 [Thermoplasmata archaeon]|nr:MAG: hypothetical protein JSW00_13865 [Thermoplasmata archaeon]